METKQQTASETRHPFYPPPTGLEGREEELGHAVRAVVKTLQTRHPYEHQVNDALVKSILTQLHFAYKRGLSDDLVDHDVETMRPVLSRIRQLIEESGEAELALVGIFDRTACHYQLALHTEAEPGQRRFPCPYNRVLGVSHRTGQHSLSVDEVHNLWCRPRWEAFGREVGVELEVSDCHGEECTVRIRDEADRVPVPATQKRAES